MRAKIQDANSKLFNHLHQIKTQKLDQLIGPQITTYIHTYVRTYVRTYIHTYIHTYIRLLQLPSWVFQLQSLH